jgi:hypothetical protein
MLLRIPSPTTSTCTLFPCLKNILYDGTTRGLRWVRWVAGLASTALGKVRAVCCVLDSYRFTFINLLN